MEKVETKLNYDDRRKVLNQKKTQTYENKDPDGKVLSSVNHELNTEYTEDGIRLAHKNMSARKKWLENRQKQLSPQFETKVPLTEEDLKLQESLKRLAQNDTVKKAEDEFKQNEEELDQLNKDLKELIEAIGTRLKF